MDYTKVGISIFIGMIVDVLTLKYQVHIATLGGFDISDNEMFFVSHLTGIYVFYLCMTTNFIHLLTNRTFPEVLGIVFGYIVVSRHRRVSTAILAVLLITFFYMWLFGWMGDGKKLLSEPWQSIVGFYAGTVIGGLFKQI